MTGGDIALVIGATTTLITTVVASFIALRRDIKGVHHLVNQASTDATAYNLKLSNTLRDHGIVVPVDDSVVPPKD
jgi:hypothetical protein